MRTFVKNQFLGVNPLLHSVLQSDGTWDNFHNHHISDLTRFLQRDLRPLGYVAQAERSLQIRRGEGDAFDRTTFRAVAIYQQQMPIAWLELLSPSNKPGGRHFETYRDKREALLQADLMFIELDYLHHQPPTVRIPGDPGTYRIVGAVGKPGGSSIFAHDTASRAATNPENVAPRLAVGRFANNGFHVYPIGVDEALPTLTLQLRGDDAIAFDFDAPYQQTYEALFFGDVVDYDTLPAEFARYSDTDQARILTRLLALDPDPPPAPLETLPLDEALRRWGAR